MYNCQSEFSHCVYLLRCDIYKGVLYQATQGCPNYQVPFHFSATEPTPTEWCMVSLEVVISSCSFPVVVAHGVESRVCQNSDLHIGISFSSLMVSVSEYNKEKNVKEGKQRDGDTNRQTFNKQWTEWLCAHLERTHKSLINAHHSASVVKLSTVIRSWEQSHQLSLGKEFIAIFNNLRR